MSDDINLDAAIVLQFVAQIDQRVLELATQMALNAHLTQRIRDLEAGGLVQEGEASLDD